MKYLFILFICLVFSCQSPTGSSDVSNIMDTEQYLVYHSSRGNGFDIYQNTLTGDNEIQVTHDAGWEWLPQWKADKEWIIFNSQDTFGTYKMRAINLLGEQMKFDLGTLPECIISPSGVYAAYIRSWEDSTCIMITSIDNIADSLQVICSNGTNDRPKWSFDGQKLSFISDQSGSNELYIFNLSDQSTQRVTNNDLTEKYVSWSPDGKRIATTMRSDSTENDIYIIDLTTLETMQLTQTSINESEISWSLYDDLIAYHAKVEEKDDIFTIDIESGNVTQITQGQGYHGEPTWVNK